MSVVVALPSCEELYLEHRQKIYWHLLHLLGNAELAEDLSQETFVRVWKALPHLQKPHHQMSAWLYRIATNLAYDQLRRRRVISWQSLDVGYEQREDPSCLEDLICDAESIGVALKQLPPNYRRALLLWNQGYPPAAIAHKLGTAEGGSKRWEQNVPQKS
jgi:RNA polymerase sigma-70 factor, ECF subfamily